MRWADTELNTAHDGGRSISPQHEAEPRLPKEPSTPGNELPAWCISLTGRDCCGVTWYCNSSNSLTSHFSSITRPWPAKESFTRTYTDCLSTCKLALESNCHVAVAAAHPVLSSPLSFHFNLVSWDSCRRFPFFFSNHTGFCPFYLCTLFVVAISMLTFTRFDELRRKINQHLMFRKNLHPSMLLSNGSNDGYYYGTK